MCVGRSALCVHVRRSDCLLCACVSVGLPYVCMSVGLPCVCMFVSRPALWVHALVGLPALCVNV